MRFDLLLDFYVLAETRNFTIAAEHLFMTEATLSRHIKKLEEEIGAPLFIRTTRRVELTTLGTALLPYAQQSIDLKKDMDTAIAKILDAGKKQLNIAAIDIANQYFHMHNLLAKFNTKHPDITINIQSPSQPIAAMLSQNLCEMGFVPELIGYEDPNYDRIRIREDHIIALIPKDSPLARKKPVSIADFTNERLILISNGTPMYSICMQACQIHGFTPKVVMTMSSGSSIRKVVEEGMGIGILLNYPSTLLHNDYPIGEKMIFTQLDPPIPVGFNLVYPKHLSPAAKKFLAFLQQTFQTDKAK